MTRAGIAIFLKPAVRRQVEAEIEAQFAAFAATGLVLDHVNAHKHFHLHPTIGRHVVAIGRRFGVRDRPRAGRTDRRASPLRPDDASSPDAVAVHVDPATAGRARRDAERRPRLRPRVVGAMTGERLEALLRRLPPGSNEIYLHPATADRFAGSCGGYRYTDELAALIAPTTLAARQALDAPHARAA